MQEDDEMCVSGPASGTANSSEPLAMLHLELSRGEDQNRKPCTNPIIRLELFLCLCRHLHPVVLSMSVVAMTDGLFASDRLESIVK